MVGHCVDTIGFIFDKASVKIKHKKEKVPKSSNTSSLTTVCTTFKDKRSSSSSESNPYYSSSIYSSENVSSNSISSISMPCLKSSQFGSCSKNSSSCSSFSSSSSSSLCSSSLSSCSLSSCSLSLSSCSTPSLTLNSDKHISSNSSSICDKNKFIITNTDSSSSAKNKKNHHHNKKVCNKDYKPCIKPICYEPSICGIDNKCGKKKCSHKNKKKFKTDIFNKLNKYCLIKLTKENFMSSTLSVCSDNKDECWIKFTENLYELLGGSFLITFTKCNIFRTLYCQLLKINYCACCQELKLFFKYNLLPPKKIDEECYNNINNIDLYYKLENCVYHNLRFYYDRDYNFNPRNFINI